MPAYPRDACAHALAPRLAPRHARAAGAEIASEISPEMRAEIARLPPQELCEPTNPIAASLVDSPATTALIALCASPDEVPVCSTMISAMISAI